MSSSLVTGALRTLRLALIPVLVAATSVSAQQPAGSRPATDTTTPRPRVHLAGIVTTGDGQPIPGAEVIDVSTGRFGRAVLTGPDGAFDLLYLKEGTVTIVIRRLGYQMQQHSYEVHPGLDEVAEIELPPARSYLDTVFVLAKRPTDRQYEAFEQRKQAGFGHFIDEQQIEKYNTGVKASELVSRVPGLIILPPARGSSTSRVRVLRHSQSLGGGDCAPIIYLNGMRLSGVEIDEVVDSNSLKGIEVYTSTSSIPVEFSGTGSACGVIALWQK